MKILPKSMRGNNDRTHGVTEFYKVSSKIEEAKESVLRKGYYVFDNMVDKKKVSLAKKKLLDIYKKQVIEVKKNNFTLEKIFDENVVRSPFVYDKLFLDFILDKNILNVVEKILGKNFILMLQNSPICIPSKSHQGFSWHRDLVWQHFTTNTPISVTVTIPLVDYTLKNGGMEILESSHKEASFPTKNYVNINKKTILAKKGSVIFFDSMCYHRSGLNKSSLSRYLLVMVFTLPFIKQQICIPSMLKKTKIEKKLKRNQKKILGYFNTVPETIIDWRISRLKRI